MHNSLELAKAYVRANIEDPACICYGVRAAMADGSELFKLTNAELVELHAFVSEVVDTVPSSLTTGRPGRWVSSSTRATRRRSVSGPTAGTGVHMMSATGWFSMARQTRELAPGSGSLSGCSRSARVSRPTSQPRASTTGACPSPCAASSCQASSTGMSAGTDVTPRLITSTTLLSG